MGIKDILTIILPTVCTGASTFIVWFLQQRVKDNDIIKKSLMLMMRRELREIYEVLKDKEKLTLDEYGEFEEIYQTYHALGGNGKGTKMYDDLKRKEIE